MGLVVGSAVWTPMNSLQCDEEREREMVHQCDTSVTLGDVIIKRVGNHEI